MRSGRGSWGQIDPGAANVCVKVLICGVDDEWYHPSDKIGGDTSRNAGAARDV